MIFSCRKIWRNRLFEWQKLVIHWSMRSDAPIYRTTATRAMGIYRVLMRYTPLGNWEWPGAGHALFLLLECPSSRFDGRNQTAVEILNMWRTPLSMVIGMVSKFRLSFWYVVGRDKWKRMEQKKKKSITIWGYSEGFKIDLPKNLNRDLRYCSSSRQVWPLIIPPNCYGFFFFFFILFYLSRFTTYQKESRKSFAYPKYISLYLDRAVIVIAQYLTIVMRVYRDILIGVRHTYRSVQW